MQAEIVYLEDEGEDLDGHGVGWRRFTVHMAVYARHRRRDMELVTVPASGRFTDESTLFLDLDCTALLEG